MRTDLFQTVTFIVALAAPLLSYIIASRRLSGRIGTSEASSLWEESRSMRDDYRERVGSLEKRILSLEERVVKLEHDNQVLRVENSTLAAENGRLNKLIDRLRGQVEVLTLENLGLKKAVADLQ